MESVASKEKSEFYNEEVSLLMGTTEGSIIMFDPILRSRLEIKDFKYDFERK